MFPDVYALEFKCHNALKYNAYFLSSHVKAQMIKDGITNISDVDWQIYIIYHVLGDTNISKECIYNFVNEVNMTSMQYVVNAEQDIVVKIRKKYSKPHSCLSEKDVKSGFITPSHFKNRR